MRRSERIKTGVIIGLIIMDIALGVGTWIREKQAEAAQWIGTIPMANQHIEWTGAGYSFDWEHMAGTGAEE